MEGGNFFKRTGKLFCFAKATEVMNSQSSNDFRWSVKLNGHLGCPAFSYKIGIASKFTGPMYSYGRYEVNTENAITLRLDLILKVSHNAIEIGI